jgi:hypothetical protein
MARQFLSLPPENEEPGPTAEHYFAASASLCHLIRLTELSFSQEDL